MTEARVEGADVANVHRLLLPAARRLCADGSACVLRLSAQPDDHDRLSVLRLTPDGAPGRPAGIDTLHPWRPRSLADLLREGGQILRRAPERTRALASLRRAAGILAARAGGAVAIADAGHAALLLWTETEDGAAWSISTSEADGQRPAPRRRALAANGAAAALAIALDRHQQGPHALPPGAIAVLGGNGPLLPKTAHARLPLEALWQALRADPDARGALLALLADQPLLLLATSGPEPRATRLVATLDGAGESLTPLFLGRC